MFKGIIRRNLTQKSILPQILFIILLLIALSNTASATSQRNIVNGDFNTNLSGWTVRVGSPVWSSVGHGASGSVYDVVNYNGLGTTGLYQVVNTTGSAHPTIKFWVKANSANQRAMVSYGVSAFWEVLLTDTNWHYYCLDLSNSATYPHGLNDISLDFAAISYPGYPLNQIYYDDIVLDNNTPPVSPVANFTGSSVSGGVPLEVLFNDTSSNSPTSWLWYTENEIVGTTKNLSNIYSNSGSYNVALKATNSAGSDWENKTNYITVSPDTVIWYNLGDGGLYLNANITNYLASHENEGYYMYYYIWENTSLGNYKHYEDLYFEDNILHPFTTFTPHFPTANTATSSLYVQFMQPGSYHDVLAGSATWGNNYYNNDTLNSSDIPIVEPDVPPVPPVDPPVPDPTPNPEPTPGPGPAPPNPEPTPGPEPPLPPAPNNGSGNGSGDFPLEEPGNASLNYSGLGSYYTYVDSVFAPVRSSVMGVLEFVVSPITALTGYVSDLGIYLTEYSAGVGNTSFIASVVRPVFLAVPSQVYGLMCLSLLFTILAFVFRYR